MSTFSATANNSSTIGYAQYGSSSWSTGSSNGACQGAYQGTTAAKSRVGVMMFNNAGATLKGKVIQQISLSITCSGAGSGSGSSITSTGSSGSGAGVGSGSGSTGSVDSSASGSARAIRSDSVTALRK